MGWLKNILACTMTVQIIACSSADPNSAFKKANETHALSSLKKYQIAQNLYQVSDGRGEYGSIQALYEAGEGVIDNSLFDAWDRSPSPKPLGGYLFSEIEQDTTGEPINRAERAGLCAYPAKPAKTGDHVICAISDSRHFTPREISGGAFVSHGEEWTIYKARYEEIGAPIRRFPSDSELAAKFQALEKLTPEKGVQKARRLTGRPD